MVSSKHEQCNKRRNKANKKTKPTTLAAYRFDVSTVSCTEYEALTLARNQDAKRREEIRNKHIDSTRATYERTAQFTGTKRAQEDDDEDIGTYMQIDKLAHIVSSDRPHSAARHHICTYLLHWQRIFMLNTCSERDLLAIVGHIAKH